MPRTSVKSSATLENERMTKKRRSSVPREMHVFEPDGLGHNPHCLKCGKPKYDPKNGFTHDFLTELDHRVAPKLEQIVEQRLAERIKGMGRRKEKHRHPAKPLTKLAKPKRRPAARAGRPKERT
jgi:hypothetical protein